MIDISEYRTPIGYPSWVLVSKFGDVFLAERWAKCGTRKLKEMFCAKKDDGHRYKCVQFRINGKSKSHKIHRLVLMAFSGCNGVGLDANHKNGIRHDNNFENLEWCTRSENHFHAYRELGRVGAMKGKVPYNKGVFNNQKFSKPIIGKSVSNGREIKFISVSDSGRNGFCKRGIFACLAGKQKTANGFTWMYL